MCITLIGMATFRKKSLYVYTISFLLLATLAGLSLFSYVHADDDRDDDHYGCDKDDDSHDSDNDDDEHDRGERRQKEHSRWDSGDFSSLNRRAKHRIFSAFFFITAVGSMFALGLHFFRSRK